MRHDEAVVTDALLIWLVTYVSFLALFGFVFIVGRGFTGRHWPNGAILRTASLLAFIGATAFWILVVIVD